MHANAIQIAIKIPFAASIFFPFFIFLFFFFSRGREYIRGFLREIVARSSKISSFSFSLLSCYIYIYVCVRIEFYTFKVKSVILENATTIPLLFLFFLKRKEGSGESLNSILSTPFSLLQVEFPSRSRNPLLVTFLI